MFFKLLVPEGTSINYIMGAIGNNNFKIYFYVEDIANLLQRINLPGWIEEISSCKMGEVISNCHSISQDKWVIEYNALLNVLEKLLPNGEKLYNLLKYDRILLGRKVSFIPYFTEGPPFQGKFFKEWMEDLKKLQLQFKKAKNRQSILHLPLY